MKKKKVEPPPPLPEPIAGVKGFNKDMKCIDMQYEVGREFEMPAAKTLKCCPDDPGTEGGLHFCENPLDVFGYYAPADSKFAEVESRGEIQRANDDSKIATSRLFIKAEISLNHLIGLGVKFILDRVNFKDAKESASGNQSAATNTGNQSAATNTGNQSAATNTGYQSAATNTGYQSAATNTGDQSAATNTGYQSAATNTGYQSAAIVEGKESIAIATGAEGKAKGKIGCWLVLAEWQRKSDGWHIIDVKSFPIDGNEVKEDVFYSLKNGKAIEVE